MSFLTALSCFQNLRTKRRADASDVVCRFTGIIGIALILSISNGVESLHSEYGGGDAL
ncbi:MAG: hypothetical protein ACLTSZ_03590 [Lachnospiraceae bacterium]